MEKISGEESPDIAYKLLKVLKSDINLRILALLSSRPSYPRELALLLGKDETDISRRLNKLEKIGLVESLWSRIENRNVKLYRLTAKGLSVNFMNGRIFINVSEPVTRTTNIRVVKNLIPSSEFLIGRTEEYISLVNVNSRVIHIWGPPGIGKTSLAAYSISKTAGERPVYWYTYTPGESLSSFKWRLGVFIQNYLNPNYEDVHDNSKLLKEIEKHELILVIDDYHFLDENTRKFLRWLANNISRAKLYILSRQREKRLPIHSGKVYVLELRPLLPKDSMRLAEEYYYRYGMLPEKQELDMIVKASRGIPLLVKGIVRLHVESRVPVETAIKEILSGYYKGQITGYLREQEQDVLEALITANGELGYDILCDIVESGKGSCEKIIQKLDDLGLVTMVNERIMLREFLSGLRSLIPSSRRRSLSKLISKTLYKSGDQKDKIRSIDLLAEECLSQEASTLVSQRLYSGASWFLCCPDYYLSVLDKILGCPLQDTYQFGLFMIERALVGDLILAHNPSHFLEVTGSYLGSLRKNYAVYARVAALYAQNLLRNGRVNEAKKWIAEVERILDQISYRKRKYIYPSLYAAKLLYSYFNEDIESAIEYAKLEAESDLELGDLLNYAKSKVDIALLSMLAGKNDTEKHVDDIDSILDLQPPRARNHLEQYSVYVRAWIELQKGNYGNTIRLANMYLSRPDWKSLEDSIKIAWLAAQFLRGAGRKDVLLGLEKLGLDCSQPAEPDILLACYMLRLLTKRKAGKYYKRLPRGMKIIADSLAMRTKIPS